ncbi:alpha-protein kinase 2 [Bombina bombina]|uniref:alpha-protein kinase 2 n=1 Tax=Bombina bombina TaxID=8345 RepID=UPI00235B0332|nr:alpha-protein kinase 2 [Bombina bombina]XP_053557140.1 alpha-protein kinase 2 [Bombina bombina]
MERDSNLMVPGTYNAQNSYYHDQQILTIQELPPVNKQTLNNSTMVENTEGTDKSNNCELNMKKDETLFIFEEDIKYSEHSSPIHNPMDEDKTKNVSSSISNQTSSNGDLQISNKLPGIFTCHTGTMAHVFYVWHTPKYCCSAIEPNWDDHTTGAEELFDDCLNYLECTDVLRDYVNEIWQRSMIDNDPDFVLASDQGDETKVSQDCLNGCEHFLTGITCVNEVSNNTPAIDDLTGHCDSHSDLPEAAVKRELSGDCLRDLHTEMVITVGHPQDESSSVKNKERCKLVLVAAAIQNDHAGIEEEYTENNLSGIVSIHGKTNKDGKVADLFPARFVNSLQAMTEEPKSYQLIQAGSEKEQCAIHRLDDKMSATLDKDISTIAINCEQGDSHFSDSTPNNSEYIKLLNKKHIGPELSKVLTEPMDTNYNCSTDLCEENKDSEEQGDITKLKTIKSNNIDQSLLNDKIDVCVSIKETDQAVDYQNDHHNNQTEKCLAQSVETNTTPTTLVECLLDKNKNKQKHIFGTCAQERLYNSQGIVLWEAEKEHKDQGCTCEPREQELDIFDTEVGASPKKKTDKKCKKQDSLDDGYHSLGMSCEQQGTDAQIKDEERIIMAESETYINQVNETLDHAQCKVGNIKKVHINQLDDQKHSNNEVEKSKELDDVTGRRSVENTSSHRQDFPTVNERLNSKVHLTTCKKAENVGLCNTKTLVDYTRRTTDTLPCDIKGNVVNKSNKQKSNPKTESSKRKLSVPSLQNKKNCTSIDGDQPNTKLGIANLSTIVRKKPIHFTRELSVASDRSVHENEDALLLKAKVDIPNSNESLKVCKNADTDLKGHRVQNLQSLSCSGHPVAVTNSTVKNAENKAVRKKLKGHGKEQAKISKCEKDTLAGDVSLAVDEGKSYNKESNTEISALKDNKKAPQLIHAVQAEMFPDGSGNMKLCCHFAEIHADSTVTWTKDSKLLARIHRSSKDDSPVSLAIVQTSKQDQGLYQCILKNMYGRVSTEFHLTSEVLEQLSRYQDIDGGEEIEFNQLLFREDFISDMYFGGNLHGRISTEDLHFGEGVHRKAFRSTVMCGLLPVFNPGHLCVLKVHNAIAYGTKTNDELVQRNYNLAVQECYVQNTAREYAKIYAAEAERLKDFGTVPEIIPIFLIHRPANNIPYATVEEELLGDFVKYSVRDGKEINFLRRDSEAGQKCCTFQHWVYEKTNGNLLVTDMQGVGMKLTDVGIATIAKGYKGFKGNCSVSFIDQFKALHLCNKYCEKLGLKSLKPSNQKQKKPIASKEKNQPIPPATQKSKLGTKTKNKT